jgi:hypothetical protein
MTDQGSVGIRLWVFRLIGVAFIFALVALLAAAIDWCTARVVTEWGTVEESTAELRGVGHGYFGGDPQVFFLPTQVKVETDSGEWVSIRQDSRLSPAERSRVLVRYRRGRFANYSVYAMKWGGEHTR